LARIEIQSVGQASTLIAEVPARIRHASSG